MKKLIQVLTITLLTQVNANSQNLVPNPSFEIYTACPDNISSPGDDQVLKATGWSSFRETSDYFNTCANATFWQAGVPSNVVGVQAARDGKGYLGLATFVRNTANAREFIGAKLTTTLTIGKNFVNLFANLAGKPGITLACNKIGVRFSKNSFSVLNPAPINNKAHVYTTVKLIDTMNWVKISGSFIADSAYKYLCIGNFFDDANTDTLSMNVGLYSSNLSYYFIDDVCVSLDSLCSKNPVGFMNSNLRRGINIYPNPFINKLTVSIDTEEKVEKLLYKIINHLGQSIIEQTISENKFEVLLDEVPSGIYMFCLIVQGQLLKQTLIKE